MTQVTLTEEQARLIRRAKDTIQLCDPTGNVVAHAQVSAAVVHLSPQEQKAVAEHLRRKSEKREECFSSDHVQAMLHALDQEWQRTGGFDVAYLHKFIETFRPEDAR